MFRVMGRPWRPLALHALGLWVQRGEGEGEGGRGAKEKPRVKTAAHIRVKIYNMRRGYNGYGRPLHLSLVSRPYRTHDSRHTAGAVCVEGIK